MKVKEFRCIDFSKAFDYFLKTDLYGTASLADFEAFYHRYFNKNMDLSNLQFVAEDILDHSSNNEVFSHASRESATVTIMAEFVNQCCYTIFTWSPDESKD